MARSSDEKEARGHASRIEIAGTFDPHTIELLQLELRRLAVRHGVEITSMRTEKKVAMVSAPARVSEPRPGGSPAR